MYWQEKPSNRLIELWRLLCMRKLAYLPACLIAFSRSTYFSQLPSIWYLFALLKFEKFKNPAATLPSTGYWSNYLALSLSLCPCPTPGNAQRAAEAAPHSGTIPRDDVVPSRNLLFCFELLLGAMLNLNEFPY